MTPRSPLPSSASSLFYLQCILYKCSYRMYTFPFSPNLFSLYLTTFKRFTPQSPPCINVPHYSAVFSPSCTITHRVRSISEGPQRRVPFATLNRAEPKMLTRFPFESSVTSAEISSSSPVKEGLIRSHDIRIRYE